MTCKDCIHKNVCVIIAFPDAFENTKWEKEHCDYCKNKADYAEVKHGEWIEGKTLEKCSLCGKKGFSDWHYCPACGAKMDGNNLSTIPTGSEGSSDNEQSI